LWQNAETLDNQYICLPKQTYSVVLHDRPGNIATVNADYRDDAIADTLHTGSFSFYNETFMDVEFVQLNKFTERQLNYMSVKQGNVSQTRSTYSIDLACRRNDPIPWVAMCNGDNLSNDAAFELDGVRYPCFRKERMYCSTQWVPRDGKGWLCDAAIDTIKEQCNHGESHTDNGITATCEDGQWVIYDEERFERIMHKIDATCT